MPQCSHPLLFDPQTRLKSYKRAADMATYRGTRKLPKDLSTFTTDGSVQNRRTRARGRREPLARIPPPPPHSTSAKRAQQTCHRCQQLLASIKSLSKTLASFVDDVNVEKVETNHASSSSSRDPQHHSRNLSRSHEMVDPFLEDVVMSSASPTYPSFSPFRTNRVDAHENDVPQPLSIDSMDWQYEPLILIVSPT